MKCPGCARDNREGAAFCDGCGTALERTCSKCGAELRGDARFCDSCGERVVTAATDVRSRTPEHLVEKILKERTGIEGERRNVTVMFVDAKGFTPLSERLDAEQVYSFTQGCTERMLAAVHRHEGTVTQFTGDGIVALFGAPIAHEDSARRAVAAALDMQGSLSSYVAETGVDTAFRVGLNTGPVVVGRVGEDLSMDYTAVGDTVNLAARMEQIAEPGAVFMTSHTYQGASDYFECVDLGLREVKGKSEPVHVYRPIVATGARTRIDAAVARGLSPFVGRDRDIGVLMGLWEEANAGRGQIVMISGEPGIGKSRLLLEFRRALGDDVVWREAHCISYGEEIPYLPVIELVKNGFGINDSDDDGTIIAKVDTDVALWSPETQKMAPYLKFLLQVDPGDARVEAMDPVERRAGILDALRALVIERSKVAPRVVVVEDLHWADDQSEEAFRVCADAVAASRVLMILTFRPGYMHPSAEMPNSHRIALTNLDDRARAELASSSLSASSLSPDLAEAITTKAEGNPLFIEEVAKALAAGVTDVNSVPNSLQDVILARIDRLETSARESLQLASVIGREFTLRLLNRISSLSTELEGVLSELKMLELIYEKTFFPELAYMFKHALTHDVAYSTLLLEKRKTLHRIVAAAIEELYEDRIAEHYETLAHHYGLAQESAKAADYLEKAGDKAASTFANEEAMRFYASAIEVLDEVSPREDERIASIAGRRASIGIRIGHFDDAVADFARQGEIARTRGDDYAEAMSWANRSFALCFAHDLEQSYAAAGEALRVGGNYDDVRFIGQTTQAWYELYTNDFDGYRRNLAGAGSVIDKVRDPFFRGLWGWYSPLSEHWNGKYDSALVSIDAWREEREVAGGAMSTLWGHWVEGLVRGQRGDYERAIELFTDVITDAERVGDALILWRSVNSIGWVYLELQDLDKAIEWNMRGLEGALNAGFPDPEIEGNAALNLADAYVSLGRFDQAEEQYAWVEKIYRSPSPPQRFMLWRYAQHLLHSYGKLWQLRGDTAKARAYAEECISFSSDAGSTKNVVKGKRLLGQVLADEGDLAGAEREIAEALQMAIELGNPGQLWETWDAFGDVRAALGPPADADAAYRQANAVIERVASSLSDQALRDTFLASAHISEIRQKVR